MSMLKKVITIEANKGLQYFIDGWGKIKDGEIVYICIDKFEFDEPKAEIVLDIFNNDTAIGFVYTDFFIYDSEGLKIQQFLDDKNLPSIPFFAKKANNLNMSFIKEENIIASVMQAYINQGYRFEHLAENCLGHAV